MGLFSRKPAPGTVKISKDGSVRARWKTPADARAVLQQLRMERRQLMLVKRQIMEQQRILRAQYTDRTRSRGGGFTGGGHFGRALRAVDQLGRASDRQKLAKALAPLEQQRMGLEARITEIDRAILRVQQSR